MMHLNNILSNVDILETKGTPGDIANLTFDSRKAEPGFLFMAFEGTAADGHQFIDTAVEKGAVAVLCEKMPANTRDNVCYVRVKDSHRATGICAANFYDNPSRKLKLVGVTGTNGKTTIVNLLHQLFIALGYKTGMLSTIKNMVHRSEVNATHTTPDPIQLNALLNDMAVAGCDYCFMEVSSHAIHQQRIAGLEFAGGIFTNITHDHLDYHKTFSEYIKAKKGFFDSLSRKAFAISNADDKNGHIMLQNCNAEHFYYSIRSMADFKGRILESHFNGMQLNIDAHDIWLRLIGKFNASNILAVYAAAKCLDCDTEEILTAISDLNTVEGRIDTMNLNGITAIVDYAHTPDALSNVMQTVNDIRTGNETFITVMGAGGNRDREKRPEMGAVAAKHCNKLIITSDNPRNEEPQTIINEIAAGVNAEDKRKVLQISQREEAIKTACMLAQKGDIILVAGKGHENYQEMNGVRKPFNDKEQLIENLA